MEKRLVGTRVVGDGGPGSRDAARRPTYGARINLGGGLVCASSVIKPPMSSE